MSKHILSLLLISMTCIWAAELAQPDAILSFDGTPAGILGNGQALKAQVQGKPGYVPGLRGQAVEITRTNGAVLAYDAQNLLGKQGTVSFWIKPYWNGLPLGQDHYLLQTEKKDGKRDFRFWFWTWLRADIPLQGTQGIMELKGGLRQDVTKHDWLHVAMTWNRRNWSKIYVNGEPVEEKRFSGIDLEQVQRFAIGSDLDGTSPFEGAIDEVKLFAKALDDQDIRAEYRRLAMVDLTMDESLVKPGKKVPLTVTVSPLGTRTGKALEPETRNSAQAAIAMRLMSEQDEIMAEKEFGTVNAGREGKNLTMMVPDLKAGAYRLEVKTDRNKASVSRSFKVFAAEVKPQLGTGEDYVCSKPIFTKVLDAPTGGKGKVCQLDGQTYLEAGTAKNENIYCEIPIPEEYRHGELLELEIRWPDDKPRNAGFYLYPAAGSQSLIRDRLGTGLASGDEYPLTNTMRTARYLVFAGTPAYLFEARTLAEGRPAAVASVTLRPVQGGLPPLKLHLPEGMRGRSIGHLDEDQSFDYNLDWDNTRPKLTAGQVEAKLITKLCEYYAYTGQNSVSLPLLRYDWVSQETTTVPSCQGILPFLRGSIPFWMKALDEHGIDFITIINVNSLPELTVPDKQRFFRKNNYFSRDKVGTVLKINPFHPEVQKLLERQIEDFASRFATRQGLTGIDLWLEWDGIGFRGLERGYDDETMRQFTKDTGIKVKEREDDVYGSRHAYLTSPARRKVWIDWRVAKTTAQIQRIRQIFNRYNPSLPLYVSISGLPLSGSVQERSSEGLDVLRNLREEHGLDVQSVNALPNVMVVPMRRSTFQRWHQCWGGTMATTDESIYNRQMLKPFRQKRGNVVSSYRQYFESFSKSPINDRYPGYFQNADVKPHGRYFLKELAHCLAFTDAQRIAMGAQPLATLGNERETREFTRAYRALPDRPFKDLAKAMDPVTLRYLQTKNGTYVYAVSLIHAPTTVELSLPDDCTVTDLSTDQKLPVEHQRLTVSLKPYELRSFLLTGTVVPEMQKVAVSEAFRRDCLESLERLEAIVKNMADAKLEVRELTGRLSAARRALDGGEYAEFWRLRQSKVIRLLESEQVAAFEQGFLIQALQMRKRGHVAVNCGSSSYVRTASGHLFLPDRKWDGQGDYGFVGKGTTVMRNTSSMPKHDKVPLFTSELYDIDGYRFRAKPGRYSIRALMRIGYEPARRKGIFVLSVGVNGKVRIKDLDLYEAENKDGYVVVTLDNVTPVNGMISVELFATSDPTVRMLNAIELIPEDKR